MLSIRFFFKSIFSINFHTSAEAEATANKKSVFLLSGVAQHEIISNLHNMQTFSFMQILQLPPPIYNGTAIVGGIVVWLPQMLTK